MILSENGGLFGLSLILGELDASVVVRRIFVTSIRGTTCMTAILEQNGGNSDQSNSFIQTIYSRKFCE